MKKYCSAICLFCACMLFFVLQTGCSIVRKDYKAAKANCIVFFQNNKENLLRAFGEVAVLRKGESVTYQNYIISSVVKGYKQYAVLEYGAQGMLGGQYWGIYYSADNSFCDEYGTTVFGEDHKYYKEAEGNNFFETERIMEHYFFFYQDYDGNVHGLDWTEV